jgi:hypothetical protein
VRHTLETACTALNPKDLQCDFDPFCGLYLLEFPADFDNSTQAMDCKDVPDHAAKLRSDAVGLFIGAEIHTDVNAVMGFPHTGCMRILLITSLEALASPAYSLELPIWASGNLDPTTSCREENEVTHDLN